MNNGSPKNRNFGFSIVMMLMLLFAFFSLFGSPSAGSQMEYSEMLDLFEEHKITSFELDINSRRLYYTLEGDAAALRNEYRVPDVSLFISDVSELIEEYDAAHPGEEMEYDYSVSTNFLAVLMSWLPTILLGVMFIFFMVQMNRQNGGRMANVGKAGVKTGDSSERKATFADVAGCDEEKEELSEVVEYLRNPQEFNSLGAKIPKGVLLVGPPGTGKTLLARAVAGEAGVPFYSISGSDFVELYVGVGASRVRDLFQKAKNSRPSIIFIDEIDAVGRRRGAGLGGGHDEREQTLNQLLVEMDGFDGNQGVIVMAATNRADILDPALLRPGRFDRQVYVGAPDINGREEILRVHARNKPLAPDVELKTIAKATPGFTGADLENLLNEAALLAARSKRRAITQKDIEEASLKVMAGPEKKSRVVTEKERKLTAYHEAGHAVATYYINPETPVHQISIIPRGQAGGFTMSLPNEDTNFATKKQMERDIVVLLGGRVAEKLVLEDISTGASNDLQRATRTARSMVTKYGFSDRIGPVVWDAHDEVFLGRDFTQSRSFSERVAGEIDDEVRRIIDEAFDICESILHEHLDQIHDVAKALLENEKLDAVEFAKIMGGEITESPEENTEAAESNVEVPTIQLEEADEPSLDTSFEEVPADIQQETEE